MIGRLTAFDTAVFKIRRQIILLPDFFGDRKAYFVRTDMYRNIGYSLQI